MTHQLLIVTDKNKFIDEFTEALSPHGFEVKIISGFSEALKTLPASAPDVLMIDSTGNEITALEFCTSVKSLSHYRKSVLIFLSDRDDGAMEVAAFTSGADDFVSMPVKINALAERIKARMKQPDKTITIARDQEDISPLQIDRDSYTVSMGNTFITLSRKEFELLYLMASNPDRLFRRDEIFHLIWNKKITEKNRTIDVHILRLRKKLGSRFIFTQKGIGYRFLA